MSRVEKAQDEWLSELSKLQRERVPQIPSGWLTVRAIAKQINKSVSHTTKLTKDLCDSGRAERKKFMILDGDKIRQVSHYKLKK